MKKTIALILTIVSLLLLFGCEKKLYLEDYITECRYNTLRGAEDDYKVEAHLTSKEFPYLTDGKVGPVQDFIEIYLYTPDNTATYDIYFEKSGEKYGGEMNYNSSKSRQELSFQYADKNALSIDFIVTVNEDDSFILTAATVVQPGIMTPQKTLALLFEEEGELFERLTVNGELLGEIQIRLLSENEKNYYFIGVIDRESKIYAFLVIADSGAVIARKEIRYKTNLAR